MAQENGQRAACAFRGTGWTCAPGGLGQVIGGPRHAGRDGQPVERMEISAAGRRRGVDRRTGRHRTNRPALLATTRPGRLTLPGGGPLAMGTTARTRRHRTSPASRLRSAITERPRKIGRQQANRQQCANPPPHDEYPLELSRKYIVRRGRSANRPPVYARAKARTLGTVPPPAGDRRGRGSPRRSAISPLKRHRLPWYSINSSAMTKLAIETSSDDAWDV